MRTLETGKKFNTCKGFSLIELLTVLVIIGIVASLTRLAIPDNEGRVWENETSQLIALLNQANDESITMGVSIEAVIDQQGWRFHRFNIKQERVLMGDVFQSHFWERTTSVEGNTNCLIDEMPTNSPWEITLRRNNFVATLQRDSGGRFVLKRP